MSTKEQVHKYLELNNKEKQDCVAPGYHVKQYLDLLEEDKHEIFVPFDEFQDFNPKEMGTATKTFVMCKGSQLLDMYDYLKKYPKNNFCTCLDPLFPNITKEEFKKRKISVILKMARYDDKEYTTAEVAACKLADIFNIRTPYITHVKDDPNLIMSVDFLSEGQQMETFAEMANAKNVGKIHGIKTWLDQLENMVKQYPQISEDQYKNMKIDLIRIFLIRRFVLMDNDLNSGNVAFVFNKDYSGMKLMSFDYEYCFNNNSRVFDMTKAIPKDFKEKNVEWLLKNCPEELSVIMQELSVIDSKEQRIKEALDTYKISEGMKEFWKRKIVVNVKTLCDLCSVLQNSIDENQQQR